MSRYIKKTESNPGPFEVRLEANIYVRNSVARNVEITDDPQPFETNEAQHLLNTNPGLVEEVALEDVPEKFLSEADRPERIKCDVEDCGRDYASQANLEKHRKSTHGNLLEKLLTPSS